MRSGGLVARADSELFAMLQLREHGHHRRRSVRVVMDHSPPATVSSIDIRHPVPDGDWMSAKLALTLLHTEFVRNVALDTDELILQSDISVRGDLSEPLERSAYGFPANFPTVDRVLRCHVWSVRPGAGHWTGIAVGHPVQCTVELLRSAAHVFFC
jgi:hypothetical protein